MEKPYLILNIDDFDAQHILVRLLVNRWDRYYAIPSDTIWELESLGIISIESAPPSYYRHGAVQIVLTVLGCACVLSDNEPKLYIPIEV